MRTTVIIQNLKCNGCKNAVTKRMGQIDGISLIDIDVETSEVTFDYTTHNAMEGLRDTLIDLGYPITGDPNTIVSKAKSYFNCAIGKVTSVGPS